MANIIKANNKKVYSLGSIPAGEIVYCTSHKDTPYMVVDKRGGFLKDTNVLITYLINLETGMLVMYPSNTAAYWYDRDVILQD